MTPETDAHTGTPTTGHEWDGLRELNTPLPRWWLYTWFACIAFAAIWVVLYPAFPIMGATGVLGWTARGALPADLAEQARESEPMLARLRAVTLAQIAADPALRGYAIAGGRAVFAQNCAACHGAGGQGAPGYPNLVDDDWLWGGTLEDIHTTITHGARNPDSADARATIMPAFAQGILSPAQIGDAAEHVLSLTNRATDAVAAARGAEVFAENCVACHGERGEGNPALGAPALNDRIWLNGSSRTAIARFIAAPRLGVMPAFGPRLDAAAINMLAVYVHSLGGGR